MNTETNKEFDIVQNPEHYTKGRDHHPLDVIEDWALDYHLGNCLKYISRFGRKKDSNISDLSKAMFYLQRRLNIEIEKSIKTTDQNAYEENR